MPTRTKFVILMHPYEFKRIKANTGRLTHICLPDSNLFVGESFDQHDDVQALIKDPKNYPVLLYPGKAAIDLSAIPLSDPRLSSLTSELQARRLVVFLLDATWRLARPMLRKSLTLQALPQVMFSNAAPSRYRIKLQPEPGCLSTLEAVHEMLLALDRTGLDTYTLPKQLLDLFERMQDFQIARTEENRRLGIRRHAPKTRREVKSVMPPRSSRRKKIFPVAPKP
jgi:DTW domain-containing protein YfiP